MLYQNVEDSSIPCLEVWNFLKTYNLYFGRGGGGGGDDGGDDGDSEGGSGGCDSDDGGAGDGSMF